jgi:hypothetical protein
MMHVEVAGSDDRVDCATQWYRWLGRLHLAVIAKATFDLVPGGLMSLVDPEPIFERDRCYLLTGIEHSGQQPLMNEVGEANALWCYRGRCALSSRLRHRRALS